MTDQKRQSHASITLPTIEAVREYLRANGWRHTKHHVFGDCVANTDGEIQSFMPFNVDDSVEDVLGRLEFHESRPAADLLANIAKYEPGYNSWDEGLHPESREAAVRKAYAEGYARARLDPHGTETPKTRLVKHVDCDRDGFGNTSGGADTYISGRPHSSRACSERTDEA